MLQTARKRQSRGKIYLVIVLIIIIAGVGLYVYASSLPPGPPDFAIAAPIGVTVQAGHQTTAKVNITAVNRFTGTVQLSVTSSNSNLTATISPANVTGSGTATLTLMASTNGSYSVTVSGKSGSLDHSVIPRVATPVYAILATSDGNMTIELYPASAPLTVANFVKLAKQGFYDNLVWHRIATSPHVIQTGDPNTRYGNTSRSTWGLGGSSQTVPLEIDPSLHNNLGCLGMARSQDLNSGTSQFYINIANNNYLDGNYTVFGKVVSSMTPAYQLANTPVNSSDQPINPVFLTSVTILD
jgi:cyclophilin family peptidyl-prolyl cis-trans isomerase